MKVCCFGFRDSLWSPGPVTSGFGSLVAAFGRLSKYVLPLMQPRLNARDSVRLLQNGYFEFSEDNYYLTRSMQSNNTRG